MNTQALSTVSTLGDLLENITFLGLGLLILIVALAVCQFFVNSISKVFAETSDRIEGRSTQRKRRRHARSRKHSHLRIVSRNNAPTESPNAFRALARSVNRTQQGQTTGTSGTKRFS